MRAPSIWTEARCHVPAGVRPCASVMTVVARVNSSLVVPYGPSAPEIVAPERTGSQETLTLEMEPGSYYEGIPCVMDTSGKRYSLNLVVAKADGAKL